MTGRRGVAAPWALVPLAAALLATLLGAVEAQAQRILVYSELQRPDPFGEPVKADRAEFPREVLSPAVARNGHATFLIAVSVPKGFYHLYLAENPEGSAEYRMYRAVHERHGDGWVPDRLVRVKMPHTSRIPDAEYPVEGMTSATYLLDIKLPKDAEVRRFRLEIQLSYEGRWTIYPLEVRVFPIDAPEVQDRASPLGEPAARIDTPLIGALRAGLCGGRLPRPAPATGELSIRSLVRRNAWEDIEMARSLAQKVGKDFLLAQVAGEAGVSPERWCREPRVNTEHGAEWYLRVRDFLFQMGREPGDWP